MMGTATATGPDRARIAAEQAIACPLLEGIDLSGAKGVLVLVTASKGSLKLSESRLAMNTINAYASPDAHVIFGAAYDDSLGDAIRVTVVATGLSRPNMRRQPISVVQGGLRTGTDNLSFAMAGGGVAPAAVVSGMPTDYGNMKTPSVWRNNRAASTAAARVDALSMGGMEEVEIPAYLRKQAD
jgi:cell division protein FtsZ